MNMDLCKNSMRKEKEYKIAEKERNIL
jgi:hypothetical protein